MAYRRTERVGRRLAARRDAILAAARAAAMEGGMTAVQIVPVAERAGIAAGTVYRYFSSKEDLIGEMVGAISMRELAAMRAAADAAPGPLSALAAALATFAARALHERRLSWAVMAEPVEDEIGAPRLAFRKSLAAEIEKRIKAAMNGGHLPEQDAAVAAAAVIGAVMEGLIGPLAPERSSDPVKWREAVQTVTLLALRALGVIDARARGLVAQVKLPDAAA